ncbi:response regulator transcription factor [Flaviflagellibacter deserti]|uniref:Response regulator transcription factor n=1 Tax=Flaviflagellibacter deserti TaxID=2267266 RepID=A0ABV9YYG1_9HYPH
MVFIVDDDPSVRDSLQNLLCSVDQAVEGFASPTEFLEAERPDVPSCLVLDVRLPGQSGLEFHRQLTRSGIHLPIVFITGHGDVPMSVAAMKAGAIEFLTKPFREQDLLDAVQKGVELDRRRRAELATLKDILDRYETLTQREKEILTFVTAGRINKQVAADLDVSEITVKTHRAQIMRKMKAASLPDLVRMADRIAADIP